MSYICEFCGIRPENCACAIDLTEPRLETELTVADNIMAVENQVIQRSYGLLDAPSASAFFSLLMEMESESKYDTPPSTPISTINLPPPPKLERQNNRPFELNLSEEDLTNIQSELFPDAEFLIQSCQTCHEFGCDCERTQVCLTPRCENMVSNGMCYDCIMAHHNQKDQLAREAYETARDCGTYDYYKFSRDFPDENYDDLIKCPTCEDMIDPNDEHGMCYNCFMAEQRLYPDDIAMDLRYRDSF